MSLGIKREIPPSCSLPQRDPKRVKKEKLPETPAVPIIFRAVVTDQCWKATKSPMGLTSRIILSYSAVEIVDLPSVSMAHSIYQDTLRDYSDPDNPWIQAVRALKNGRDLEKNLSFDGAIYHAIAYYRHGLEKLKKVEEEDLGDEILFRELHLALAKALLKTNDPSDVSRSLKAFEHYMDSYRLNHQTPPHNDFLAYMQSVIDRTGKIIANLKRLIEAK